MFAKKKKQQVRHESFETEKPSNRKKPNNKQAEDEYLLMRDDNDQPNITDDDEKYGGINISDLALHIKNNEIIPDNLDNQNESCLQKFVNINDNILGFMNFIIIITASLFMLFTIYENNGISSSDNRQWTQQFIIFFFTMIVIPIIFIIIRMNIIIIHNRYYADYIHFLIICIFIIFFIFITITVINNQIESSNMNTLLIISYIILHFFIFNLTSRFWIFIHTQKFNTFLSLWLLTLIAFTFSVIIYIYYNDNKTFNTFYNELYLLRSYYVLLWIIIITYIHSKQFTSKTNKKTSFILRLEMTLATIIIPLLYILFGYNTKETKDFINYMSNGLICVSVIQLILISIICTKQTGKKSINSFSFYTPQMSQCCSSLQSKCSIIFWIFICIISLPLIIIQSISLCFYMESEEIWRKIDTFGGFVLLFMMLILTLGFAVIPSLVFSNFWKKKIFENFLFLDLESLQILYNATRIKQMYGGLNINKRFLSLSSDITAPWTKDYKTITFKHNSYKLCNNLMIGIKTTTFIHFNYKLKQQSLWRKVFCCICDRKNIQRDDIKYNYYFKKEKDDTNVNDDNEYINGESLEINTNKLQFTEYYPTKFANIRAWNGLSSELYIKTFEKALLAFITNSKSGMYFFYTSNGKFLIKSLKKSEFYFFRKIFSDYYDHLKENQNTLINKFFGMYGIKYNGNMIYFIVMESIFYSNLNVNVIYDLKGSTKGRISKQTEKVLKDLNWKNSKRQISIGNKPSILYKNQLQNDTKFLQKHKIMDYSLLVGIHNVNKNKNIHIQYKINDTFHNKPLSPYLFTFCHRGMISQNKNEIYFAGIIDILQKYNAKKKVENVMRRIKYDQKEISCAPPDVYADRMYNFLDEYIV